jgi:zinc protease
MRFFISFLFTFCLSFGLIACTPKASQEARLFDPSVDIWPHDISDVPRDKDVTYGRLANGLRYALQNNKRPENEAVIRLTIRAGSKHESEDMSGGAHFLEHMAFNGTENVPEGEMVKSLERMGLSFGADTNATTSYNRTDYRLNLPEVDHEIVDYALFLLREISDKMLIEEEAVERERGVVKAEEARRRGPQYDANQALRKFIQPDGRSLKRPTAGTPESLDAMSAEKLRRYYETYYRPERTFLVIAGDFDLAKMEAKIKENFADWNVTTPIGEEPDPELKQTEGLLAKVYDNDELTTSVTFYSAEAPKPRGDSLAERRMSLVESAANNIIQIRFNKRMQEANRPVLGAGLSYGPGRFVTNLNASASAKENDWRTAVEVLEAEIRRGRKYGFQQAELDELIANARRGLTDSANYAAKRRSGSLVGGITGAFSGGDVRTTPAFQIENFEKEVKTLTLKEIEEKFLQMWPEDFPKRVWVSGPEMQEVSEEDVLAALKAARAKPVDPPAQRQKLDFAYQDFGPAGKITSRTRVEDMDITQITFENNVRLNLKKTDFEDGWIRLTATVGEGWNYFADKPAGLSDLASSIAGGGFEAHKASELSEIFAGKSIGLSLGIGADRMGFSGSTNADDLLIQMQAWTALLTHPGYHPEWREKFTESIEASFHTIDSTPSGVAARDLGRIWHDGDPRYGMQEKETYLALTLDQVRAVLEPQFETGAIEIGIVGDFDEAAVIEAVSKTFGALPKRRAEFDPIPEAFEARFPKAGRVTLTHTGEKTQGAIYMGWPITQAWSLNTSRELSLISRIFTNRMTDLIREDLGLAYNPSAGSNFSRLYDGYAYFSASITADPKFFDAFEEAAGKIAADMRSGGITQDELDRARKPLLESFERAERENSAWLGLVARSQTHPESLDWRRSRQKTFEDFTPKQLDHAAATLFAPETLHVVKIVSSRED